MEFRALLIGLFNQLADTDRRAVHFIVGDKIPRIDRDDCTPIGSLHLLDSLFDRCLITEHNFDYLIRVFRKTHCFDAAQRLEDYKKKNVSSSISTPKSSESSILDESLLDIEDDKLRSSHHDGERHDFQLYSISEETCTESENSMLQSDGEMHSFNAIERKQSSYASGKVAYLKPRVYLIALIGFIILSIAFCLILIVILMKSSSRQKQLNSYPIIQESIILKEGSQIGGDSRNKIESFNDAKDFELSYADRCIGVELVWSRETLFSIQFLYSNNHSSNSRMTQTKELPMTSSRFSNVFMLNAREQINKINLYQHVNERNFSLIGIQFYTTDGRKSNLFGSNDGNLITESFEYYTFLYAKGRKQARKGIDMLQFVWIKKCSMDEPIHTVTRNMSEMCTFTFVSKNDSKFIHAQGIESSWYNLKHKLNLQVRHYDPTASYYEKISKRGPDIFAIVNLTSVFYHDNDVWDKYISAGNITCNIIPMV